MEVKKILITGGAGFIGSHVVDAFLQQGYEVAVLDNCMAGNKLSAKQLERINFFEGDVKDSDLVMKAAKDCTTIIHLAAIVGVDQVIQNPSETIATETIGTQNIIDAAKHYQVKKIIYASSSAVYKNTKHDKCRESDSLDLVNAYSVAKRLNELHLCAVTQEHGISTNSLRFFNIYGSRQDSRMVISRFFKQAIANQPIQVFGNGEQTRDFTHVEDVTQAILKLSEAHHINGIFNIARGVETTILELALKIKTIAHSYSPIQLVKFPKQRKNYKVKKRVGSSEKLLHAIGIQPTISLEAGLENLYTDFSQTLLESIKK